MVNAKASERLRTLREQDAYLKTFSRINSTLVTRHVTTCLTSAERTIGQSSFTANRIYLGIACPSYLRTAPDSQERYLYLCGVNYHEIAHWLFTPKMPTRRNSALSRAANRYHAAFNVLEDSKIELFLSSRYPSTKPYLINTALHIFDDNSDWSKFMLFTRQQLPVEFRRELRESAKVKFPPRMEKVLRDYALNNWSKPADAESLVKEFDEMMNDYQRATASTAPQLCHKQLPSGNTASDATQKVSRRIVEKMLKRQESVLTEDEMDAALDEWEAETSQSSDSSGSDGSSDNSDTYGSDGDDPLATLPGGDPQGLLNSDTDDFDASNLGGDSDDDAEENAGGSDGTSGGAGENADDADDADDATGAGAEDAVGGSGASSTGTKAGADQHRDDDDDEEEDEVDENEDDDDDLADDGLDLDDLDGDDLSSMRKAIVERVKTMTHRDYSSFRAAAESDRAVAGLPRAGRNIYDTVRVPDTSVRALRRALTPIFDEAEPGWNHHQASGNRFDVVGAASGTRNYDELWSSWDEGREEAQSCEIVILLDTSGSMSGSTVALTQTSSAMIDAVADFPEIDLTVMTYDTVTRLVHSTKYAQTRHMIGELTAGGGTAPGHAVLLTDAIFANSKRTHKLLMMMTDGEWTQDYLTMNESTDGNWVWETIGSFTAQGVKTMFHYFNNGGSYAGRTSAAILDLANKHFSSVREIRSLENMQDDFNETVKQLVAGR